MNNGKYPLPTGILACPQNNSQGAITLPFFQMPHPQFKLYDPEQSSQQGQTPLSLFQVARASKDSLIVPRPEDCYSLWYKYGMFDHIQQHSSQVANFALGMAHTALEAGAKVNTDLTLAAALLHDLGKTYCIKYGGDHAQLGAAWVMQETRNGPLAQAVQYHVHWPWEDVLDICMENDSLFPVFAVIYADKRVMHDTYVAIDERFEDLLQRYGKTELARQRIEGSRQQGKQLENAFLRRFGVNLDAYIAHNGRLVKRT